MPERYFNTTGPVRPHEHYCIDPLKRIDLPEIERLIERGRYFVLHAPRQTGKTSCLLALMEHLNASGRYRALYANIENAQAARSNVAEGIEAVLSSIGWRSRMHLNDASFDEVWRGFLDSSGPQSALREALSHWASAHTQPSILILDEVDALVGDTLVSVLRQIRSGYDLRPKAFPQSVVLCGVRDVRDYRIHSDIEGSVITGGSAFNVKATSLRLGDFTEAEVRELLLQHTDETGQAWSEAALAEMWRLTQGQPWLVNALAYEITDQMPEGRDRTCTIDEPLVTEARERLILRQDTHIDQLADKLREERVRRVIEPILSGTSEAHRPAEDDILYVRDLGLIRTNGHLEIANPIYHEVLPRVLTYSTQVMLPQQSSWYMRSDGSLDMARLLGAFQQFFRENSESWIERFEYREAGPQLLLQAFLQRIVNGGGRVEREYGLGRMRTDLLVVWNVPAGTQRVVIEAKLVRGSREATITQGLAQTRAYMDRCGAAEGHLVLFDTRPGLTWDERIFTETRDGIAIWGM
jgi:hypothetical protein